MDFEKITTPSFCLAKYPVTQAQYEEIMGKNPSYFKGHRPVECVSWHDAVAFCKKLSEREGRTYRLPTEAEWEFACRAGTKTEYYTGDTEEDLARAGWYVGNSDNQTHPVGQKEPNAFGLYDMHGNVWEWCADWYDEPKGRRVLRGGAWDLVSVYCRSAYRFGFGPVSRYVYLGFRVLLELP